MKNKSIIDKYRGSGKSFAEISEKISKKYPRRDYDLIEKKSFEQELKLLQQEQEKMKVDNEIKKMFKYGGMLKNKYQDGGVMGENPVPSSNVTEVPNFYKDKTMWSKNVTNLQHSEPITLDKLPIKTSLPTKIDSIKTDSPKPIQERIDQSTKITVKQPEKKIEEENTKERSAYTPALIGQGLSTALNLGILAKGYDKSEPITNPYESQALRNLQERSTDTTEQRNQILSAYNAARQNLGNVRSANVRNALETNLMNTVSSNLAQTKMVEQERMNQYKADLANALGSFGQQKAQARLAAEELTARDKGQYLSNISALGASTAESAKFFTEKNLNAINNDLLLKILAEKNPTFNINSELGKRMREGKLLKGDLVELQKLYGKEEGTALFEKFQIKEDKETKG
jgi:hypothetical protein